MEKKRVMVGMSGGVDSSVAAALLKDMGMEVCGVTLQIWPDFLEEPAEGGCCSLHAVEDARAVANHLNIPYYVMNFKELFEDSVVKYFTTEYMRGRTPNPCIACNRCVKFDAMLKKARSMGFDYVATGHYARIEEKNGSYYLKKSNAVQKDQTYALYSIAKENLPHILFPLGDYNKEQTRQLAIKYGLSVAAKKDSQEICFIPDNDYASFVKHYEKYEPPIGDFVDTFGNVLGKHKGLIHYTVGQRKGLGITFGKPMYVVALDTKNNRVVLGEDGAQYSGGLIAEDINLLIDGEVPEGMRVHAKIRYSQKEVPATLYSEPNGNVRVIFDEQQRSVTPGQSVVFYNRDTVLGGGVIKKAISENT